MQNPRILGSGIVLLSLLVFAILAEHLTPYSAIDTDIAHRLAAPSWDHILGCDLYGGDLLTSILLGARTTFYVGFLTLSLSLAIGVGTGLFAGYLGGLVDTFVMRLVDILMAFPGILLAMSLAAVMGPNVHNVVFSIAATGWTAVARLVRGQVLTIKNREYVAASVALGGSVPRIAVRHILPGIVPHLLITATFSLSGVILVEASLSFLGLGAQDFHPSWGALLSQGKEVLTEAPHLSIFPGSAILVVVLALNFLGDGLRDLLDPKEGSAR